MHSSPALLHRSHDTPSQGTASLVSRPDFGCFTGARGLIADEEARLVRLRQEIEGEARDELQRARESLEAEGRNSASGKLCATPFGIDVVGISQASLELVPDV